MKTDLTSQIKLDRVSRRYYSPANEIELAAVTREEKINTMILETAAEGARFIAGEIARYVQRFVAEKGKCVLGLGVGAETLLVYAHLISMVKAGELSFEHVVVYNIGEFSHSPRVARLLCAACMRCFSTMWIFGLKTSIPSTLISLKSRCSSIAAHTMMRLMPMAALTWWSARWARTARWRSMNPEAQSLR